MPALSATDIENNCLHSASIFTESMGKKQIFLYIPIRLSNVRLEDRTSLTACESCSNRNEDDTSIGKSTTLFTWVKVRFLQTIFMNF